MLKHPFQEYTIAGHGKSHNVVYQTARTDLLDLAGRGVLLSMTRGKKMVFNAPQDLVTRLQRMEQALGVSHLPRNAQDA